VSGISAKKDEAAYEECRCSSDKQQDRVPIGGLDGRWRSARGVEALRAALSESLRRSQYQQHCSDGKKELQSLRFHWPYSRRAKRKSQSTPIACQYQTVASTATWRVASWRERARKVSAATSAAMPRKRCAACATVMR